MHDLLRSFGPCGGGGGGGGVSHGGLQRLRNRRFMCLKNAKIMSIVHFPGNSRCSKCSLHSVEGPPPKHLEKQIEDLQFVTSLEIPGFAVTNWPVCSVTLRDTKHQCLGHELKAVVCTVVPE